ncbi:MAG: hypothetical protein ABIO46_04325, partial [Chitinophagales bacterium]
MKKYCLLIWVILSTGFVYAQNRDNIWMLAYYAGPAPYFSCGINFNSGVADTFTVEEKKMLMYFTNASICDTLGQLLFYTNGLYIANRNHDTLFNSHLFNDGALTDFYVPEGMGIPQGAIILPRPEH